MKTKLPFVSRERYETEISRERQYLNSAHEREVERLKKDWEEKWEPVLDRMMSIRVRRDDTRGDFVVSVNLEHEAMEQAASYNDPAYWNYIAKMLSVHFERQLATMNFAGLHRLANETDSKIMGLKSRMPVI